MTKLNRVEWSRMTGGRVEGVEMECWWGGGGGGGVRAGETTAAGMSVHTSNAKPKDLPTAVNFDAARKRGQRSRVIDESQPLITFTGHCYGNIHTPTNLPLKNNNQKTTKTRVACPWPFATYTTD